MESRVLLRLNKICMAGIDGQWADTDRCDATSKEMTWSVLVRTEESRRVLGFIMLTQRTASLELFGLANVDVLAYLKVEFRNVCILSRAAGICDCATGMIDACVMTESIDGRGAVTGGGHCLVRGE